MNKILNKRGSKKGHIEPLWLNNKIPVYFSLCLGKAMDGLHMDFIVSREGKKYGSSMMLSLNDKPIATYGLSWAKSTFWPMMERFGITHKKLMDK